MKILVDKLPERPEQCIFSNLSQGMGWSHYHCKFSGYYCVLERPPSYRRRCSYIEAIKTNLETEEIPHGEDYN